MAGLGLGALAPSAFAANPDPPTFRILVVCENFQFSNTNFSPTARAQAQLLKFRSIWNTQCNDFGYGDLVYVRLFNNKQLP